MTFRLFIPAKTVPATKLRLTLQPPNNYALTVTGCYVGYFGNSTGNKITFSDTPTQILFGGVGNATIAANTSLVSILIN
jgi:hypothetical protein